MAHTLQTDAYRLSSLYEQLSEQGLKEGALTATSTDAEIEAYFDTLRATGKLEGFPKKYIGEDLSEEALTSLWSHFAGEGLDSWWENKPHQLGYRLLLRLVRAENRIKELEG